MFGLLIMFGGLVGFFYLKSPENVVVGVVALIFGVAAARAWRCHQCGAKVDRDAVQCPRCALPFARAKE